MKKNAFSLFIIIGLLLVFAQCGAAEVGKKVSDEFFSAIIQQDFDKAASMVEQPVLGDTSNVKLQLQKLEYDPVLGRLKSFKKSMGFSSSITNGVKTIELPYKLTYEKGDQSFNIIIQDKGKGYKIISIS